MFESESELLLVLKTTAKSVNKVLTSGKTLVKSLEKLDSTKALDRQDYVADALDVLKTTDLAQYGCGAQQKEIMAALDQRLRTLRANAHHLLLAGLKKGIDKPENMRILSDNPLVIYVHPLTLEVNFEQAKATWTYAHEPLAVTSLDPEDILNTHKTLLETFRASRIDSQNFWSVCKLAYEMVLLKHGQQIGSRVDIVELIPPLTWLWPNPTALKKNNTLPRYLLAYQLQKLRADGLLQNRNFRLDMGTATGGSTRNKANVLFVPMGISEGQYYLSICFRQA